MPLEHERTVLQLSPHSRTSIQQQLELQYHQQQYLRVLGHIQQIKSGRPVLLEDRKLQIVQKTTSQRFQSVKKARRSSQIVHGVVYTGSVTSKPQEAGPLHPREVLSSNRDFSYFTGWETFHSNLPVAPPHINHLVNAPVTSSLRPEPSYIPAPQPSIPLDRHRGPGLPHPSRLRQRFRQHLRDNPLPSASSSCGMASPAIEIRRMRNPDLSSPNDVRLCPMDHQRTVRSEHRELFFGDYHPDHHIPEVSYPMSASLQSARLNLMSHGNRRVSDGSADPGEEVVFHELATFDHDLNEPRILTPAPMVSAESVSDVEPVSTSTLATQGEQRPTAKWSDHFKALRAWKFPHEEGEADDARCPGDLVIEHASVRPDSPVATMLEGGAGGKQLETQISRRRPSSLDVIINHFIAEDLEKSIPTAAAILQNGVGSQMTRQDRGGLAEAQRKNTKRARKG
ncbi:hypothetical protein EJ07DRAFT_155381 [Lizonia empirigonia]|nr:hypothetical protein EJ07DRAFT_155381 [Lizonia empirigonia]